MNRRPTTPDPETSDPETSEHLSALMRGHVVTQIIASAVRFGVPDHLAGPGCDDTRLSELTGIPLPVLRRYLRALQGLGLVEPAGPGRHRGTALSELLRHDTGAARGQALLSGAEYYEAWAELDHALRTGRSAFEHRHGHDLWAHLAHDDDTAEYFTRTMRWKTGQVLDEICGLHDFPESGVVADLGAGDGTLLAGLLERRPGLRGVAVELPAVIDRTRRGLTEAGLAARCEFVEGDLLESVPAGADVYVLKSVVHTCDEDAALRILRNCRRALGPGGRLLVVERGLDISDTLLSALRDLTMLVVFGGQDRTRDGYADLLRRAGCTVAAAVTGPSGLCLLAATADPRHRQDG